MTDLPAPIGSFASDNAAGVSPEVLEAMARANDGAALAYGDDPWSRRMESLLRERFDAPVEVFPCWGGTGANVVGLASVLKPWEAVICADVAHVVVDEAGALTRFAGVSVLPVAHDDGRLDPASIEPFLQWQGSEHHPQPRVVSITQATEYGAIYTPDEIGALAEAVHSAGMLLHLDGARIANALVASGADLASMIRDTGVDVMTLGLTKDGAMYGETVVFLRPELAVDARFVRKQAGQLASKARFIAAQVVALMEDDLWLRNARQANDRAAELARRVREIPGVEVPRDPAVNAVFATVPAEAIRPLQAWSFFWEWDLTADLVRWMTSFATTPEDIDRFVAGVRSIVADFHPR